MEFVSYLGWALHDNRQHCLFVPNGMHVLLDKNLLNGKFTFDETGSLLFYDSMFPVHIDMY